jgi:IS30 family transposase
VADQPECGTNTCYLSDFIEICLCPKLLNRAKIRDLYERECKSPAQIAAQFGVSRSTITARLHAQDVRLEMGDGRASNPDNYRHPSAPYGHAVKKGKLVLNKSERRVCKLIVERIRRQNQNYNEVARELSRRGIKNRAGRTKWDGKAVAKIFKRWKDKL